jgi:hypothetical protein
MSTTPTNKLKQLELFLSDTNSALNGELNKKIEAQETIHEYNKPSYVNPSIEVKLSKEKRQACRDILLEIRNFGVSQRQIMYLIYLLALELEDQAAMQAISTACGEHRENIPLTREDTALESVKTPKKKIIV